MNMKIYIAPSRRKSSEALCRPGEPTANWCWKSVENVQRC